MDEIRIGHAIIVDQATGMQRIAASAIDIAGGEFRRSRRKARLRVFRSCFGLGEDAHSIPMERSLGLFEIDIGQIAGTVDEAGRRRRGIPPMRRGLLREWCALYLRSDEESEAWRFRLREHLGAWYLAGGNAALLRLELLRMRGETSLCAKAEGLPEPKAHSGGEGRSCCEGDLGAA
jgi:hypothetical protein